ncbi:hypothetical protein HKCCE3408_08615 [Rhodobacterales bacterium HKCCE3408]|nr:hypothetical protein [Rhodobacterales bacterium HKCCE3408]
MMRMFCAITLGAALSCAAAGAEEFGTIETTYAGEGRTWFTISMVQDGETLASADLSEGRMGLVNLHLQGHPRPTFTSSDVLSIDATFMGEVAAGAEPMTLEIMYLPEGMSGPIWTSQDAPTPPMIVLETLETAEAGQVGSVAATFAGEVCFRASMREEPDPTNCNTIEGRIDSQLLFE